MPGGGPSSGQLTDDIELALAQAQGLFNGEESYFLMKLLDNTAIGSIQDHLILEEQFQEHLGNYPDIWTSKLMDTSNYLIYALNLQKN